MVRKRSYYNLDSRLELTVRQQLRVSDDIELKSSMGLYEKPLRCDSLDFVELIMDVEDEFDIQITDAEAMLLKTYGDVHDIIKRKVSMVFVLVTDDEKMQITRVSSKGDYDMQAWAGELYRTWATYDGARWAWTRMIGLVPVAKNLIKIKEVLPNL